ncbi:hypothetical protein AAH994_09315 [Weeksellaceae bacterium A-14]|uniref:hypothetical protein n=1 Tax=Daejeonia sp. YH14 TaxID=3439042 RepID=UPI0031E4D829
MKKLLFICGIATALTSCSTRLIDYTAISSKNLAVQIPETSKGERVKGEDYVTTVLGIPLGTPNLKEATDKAIEKSGNGYDILIDGVVTAKRKWYFLFGKIGYEVEGTPAKSKDFNK